MNCENKSDNTDLGMSDKKLAKNTPELETSPLENAISVVMCQLHQNGNDSGDGSVTQLSGWLLAKYCITWVKAYSSSSVMHSSAQENCPLSAKNSLPPCLHLSTNSWSKHKPGVITMYLGLVQLPDLPSSAANVLCTCTSYF